MKLSTTIIAAVVIMSISFKAFAVNKSNPLKTTNSTEIINMYVDAAIKGAGMMNQFIFAEDFKYQNSANDNNFNKKEYSKFLESTKGLQYDCETSYDILDENSQVCLAKATMQFKNFTRVDYITLNHIENGWKISKVITSYQE